MSDQSSPITPRGPAKPVHPLERVKSLQKFGQVVSSTVFKATMASTVEYAEAFGGFTPYEEALLISTPIESIERDLHEKTTTLHSLEAHLLDDLINSSLGPQILLDPHDFATQASSVLEKNLHYRDLKNEVLMIRISRARTNGIHAFLIGQTVHPTSSVSAVPAATQDQNRPPPSVAAPELSPATESAPAPDQLASAPELAAMPEFIHTENPFPPSPSSDEDLREIAFAAPSPSPEVSSTHPSFATPRDSMHASETSVRRDQSDPLSDQPEAHNQVNEGTNSPQYIDDDNKPSTLQPATEIEPLNHPGTWRRKSSELSSVPSPVENDPILAALSYLDKCKRPPVSDDDEHLEDTKRIRFE